MRLILVASLIFVSTLCPFVPVYGQCETQKLTANDPRALAEFGRALAISGDSLVMGAHAADGISGAAYVFRRIQGEWVFEQKLVAPGTPEIDWFGVSVDVEGDRLIVGAHQADIAGLSSAGKAYSFTWDGASWNLEQTLTASDPAAIANFGLYVELDGDLCFVGAPRADAPGTPNAGVVYAFERSGGTWTQTQKVVPSISSQFSDFGYHISYDAGFLAVGAPRGDRAGTTHIFEISSGVWLETSTIQPSDSSFWDSFGHSVELAVELGSNRLVVGAPLGGTRGAAYVFEFESGAWSELAILDPNLGSSFSIGQDVAIHGDWIAVGELRPVEGEAHLYHYNGNQWEFWSSIVPNEPRRSSRFGSQVSLEEGWLVVGAYGTAVNGQGGAGAVHTFIYGDTLATSQDYGSGWPGTLGIPVLTSTPPRLGQDVTISISNSQGSPTTSLLLYGTSSDDIPTLLGGRILVDVISAFSLAIPSAGVDLSSPLPCDSTLVGIPLYLQSLQLDSGASLGVSFSAGLELILGL